MNVEEIPGKLKEGLDSLRLGLADLRTQLLAKRVVLELHDGGLRGQVVGRRPAVIDVPLPPGTCRKGQPNEVEAVGDLIGDLFLELGLAGAKVSACLPSQASRWKVVRWPQGVMPESGRSELRLRAPDLGFPWPLNEVYLEVEPLPGTPARSLVVAAPRRVVDAWVEVFALAGVQLQRLLPAQACEWQMLSSLVAESSLDGEQWLLAVERKQARLWLVANGVPVADWALPGNRSGDGLDPLLAVELQRCRQFWRQHSGSQAPQHWWLYGDPDRVNLVEPGLQQLLAPESLQRLAPEALAAGLEVRLTGLKQCMGWQ